MYRGFFLRSSFSIPLEWRFPTFLRGLGSSASTRIALVIALVPRFCTESGRAERVNHRDATSCTSHALNWLYHNYQLRPVSFFFTDPTCVPRFARSTTQTAVFPKLYSRHATEFGKARKTSVSMNINKPFLVSTAPWKNSSRFYAELPFYGNEFPAPIFLLTQGFSKRGLEA